MIGACSHGTTLLAPALDAVQDPVDPRNVVGYASPNLGDQTAVTYLPFSS